MLTTKQYKSPFGVSKYVLLGIYTVGLSLYSQAIANPDPVRQLLKLNNTGTHILGNGIAREVFIEKIINFSFASVTGSMFIVNALTSYDNPRTRALIFPVIYILGMLLLFFEKNNTLNIVGGLLISLTYNLGSLVALHISALWPLNSDFVQDVLGSASEASCIVLWICYKIATSKTNNFNIETVIQTYLVIFAAYSLFQAIFVPSSPFEDGCTENFLDAMSSAPVKEGRIVKFFFKCIPALRKFKEKFHLKSISQSAYVYNNLSFIEQLTRPTVYFSIILYSVFLFTKYHMLSTFRFTVSEYARLSNVAPATANLVIELMAISGSLCWVANLVLTSIGSATSTCFMTSCLVILLILSSLTYVIPNVYVQFITVILHLLYGTLGFNYIFCAMFEYFGYHNVNSLQCIATLVGGVLCAQHTNLMDTIGNPYLRAYNHEPSDTKYLKHFQKFRLVHLIILLINCSLVFIPIHEIMIVRKAKKRIEAAQFEESEQLLHKDDGYNSDDEAYITAQPSTGLNGAVSQQQPKGHFAMISAETGKPVNENVFEYNQIDDFILQLLNSAQVQAQMAQEKRQQSEQQLLPNDSQPITFEQQHPELEFSNSQSRLEVAAVTSASDYQTHHNQTDASVSTHSIDINEVGSLPVMISSSTIGGVKLLGENSTTNSVTDASIPPCSEQPINDSITEAADNSCEFSTIVNNVNEQHSVDNNTPITKDNIEIESIESPLLEVNSPKINETYNDDTNVIATQAITENNHVELINDNEDSEDIVRTDIITEIVKVETTSDNNTNNPLINLSEGETLDEAYVAEP